MFADHARDVVPASPIAFHQPAGQASPYPRRAPRAWPLSIAVAGTFLVAFVAAALGSPHASAGTDDPAAKQPSRPAMERMSPARGEFRLAPGNAMPQGIVVPLEAPAHGAR